MSLAAFFVFGQKQISKSEKLVFVYHEKRAHNFIVIPNTGKLHSFKIYRKESRDIAFQFIVEKKKPLLPQRYNVTQYGVTWEDTGYHSRDVDYKVIAFAKGGQELCEMTVMWDKGIEN